jgi:ATP-dependent DNA helicase RecG
MKNSSLQNDVKRGGYRCKNKVFKESYNLEFKEEVSKIFLKTVSAYVNYNDGDIIFGLDDDANVVGVKESPKEEAPRLEF